MKKRTKLKREGQVKKRKIEGHWVGGVGEITTREFVDQLCVQLQSSNRKEQQSKGQREPRTDQTSPQHHCFRQTRKTPSRWPSRPVN